MQNKMRKLYNYGHIENIYNNQLTQNDKKKMPEIDFNGYGSHHKPNQKRTN